MRAGNLFQVTPAEPERRLTGNLISVDTRRSGLSQLIVPGATIRIADVLERKRDGEGTSVNARKADPCMPALLCTIVSHCVAPPANISRPPSSVRIIKSRSAASRRELRQSCLEEREREREEASGTGLFLAVAMENRRSGDFVGRLRLLTIATGHPRVARACSV